MTASAPPEILSQIFRETLTEKSAISSSSGPLLVCQVSQKWRHAALSDSDLWASLTINITPSTKSHHLDMVKLWLERSLCQPLSISVVMDPFTDLTPEVRKVVQTVFRILSGVSTRWRRVELVLPGSSQLFSELCASHAPNLQFLSFKLGNWTAEKAWDINNLLQRAPSIRELTWSNRSSWGSWDTPFQGGLEHLGVSWHSLSDVILDTYITLKTAIDILRECSSIVTVDFRHFSCGSELDDPRQLLDANSSIVLPNLKSLSLYQHKLDDGLAILLDIISCPNIETFNFTAGFIELAQWPQSSFRNFLARSACRLHSLMLEFTGITEDQLIQCVEQNSTSLQRLAVYDARGNFCVGDKLLNMLRVRTTVFGERLVTCPNMHTLILHRVVNCTDSTLASALESRTISSLARHGNAPPSVPLLHDIIFSKCFYQTNASDMQYLSSYQNQDK